VNFSEQPASKQWAALKYRGKTIAEIWFKPHDEPFALRFRVPQSTFQTPGVGQCLTMATLLKVVGIATDEVESWQQGGVSHSGLNGSNVELRQPLPPPAADLTYLDIYVSLRRPPEIVAKETSEAVIPSTKQQDLEARWNAILGLEASIDTLRATMEGVRVELEASWKKTLTHEEKLHGLRADVHQWTKAKARVPFALPKVREFVHRATWALGAPERKKLGKLFKKHTERAIPLPEMDRLPQQLARLLKDRQVLSTQGAAVYQECKSIAAEIQACLRRLQANAATNARRHRT
jgi:hypothetical protein